MPTHLIEFSPELREALKQIAPKVRRSRFPLILALAVAVAAGSVAVVPAARQRVAAAALRAWHRAHATTAATPPATMEARPVPSAPPLDSARAALGAAPQVVPAPSAVATATATASTPRPPVTPRKSNRRAPR